MGTSGWAALLVLFTFAVFSGAASLRHVRDFNGTSLFEGAEFGESVVLSSEGAQSWSDTWRAVGYAQARSRSFQVFLRLAAANGMLSTFLGAQYEEADLRALHMSYRDDELLEQYSALLPEAQAQYEAFAEGVRLFFSQEDALADYAFVKLGVTRFPERLLSRAGQLRYAVYTLNRLGAGCDPIFQLENLLLWQSLSESQFEDVATRLGAFSLDNVVAARAPAPPPGGLPGAPKRPSYSPAQVSLALDYLEGTQSSEQVVLELGAVSRDGSWTAVHKAGFAQFGPQDALDFPSTFFEVHIDTPSVQAHFFTEVGMPVNQVYGVFGGVAAGRNRGYLASNDYCFVHESEVFYSHNVTVNGASHAVYRTKKGFVVARDGKGTTLALCDPFWGQEMRGLNMLARLFAPKQDFGAFVKLLEPQLQSNVIHSHLLFVDGHGNVGAALNGQWSSLPPAYERRVPLVNPNISLYEIEEPVYELNERDFYLGWNAPFNRVLPWSGARKYGGEWRTRWMERFFEAHPEPTYAQVSMDFPLWMGKSSALQNGGRSHVDRFSEHLKDVMLGALPDEAGVFRDTVELLRDYDDTAYANNLGGDLSEAYVLANAWVFNMMNVTFGHLMPGSVNAATQLPHVAPDQRYEAIIILMAHESAELNHAWLPANTSFAQLAVSSLIDVWSKLPARPWGKGQRTQEHMFSIGKLFASPVRSLPAAQLPSMTGAVHMGACGAIAFSSALNFGASGSILNATSFGAHSLDQFPLYENYTLKPAVRLLNATRACRDMPLNITLAVSGALATVVAVIVIVRQCVVKRNKREKAQYKQIS